MMRCAVCGEFFTGAAVYLNGAPAHYTECPEIRERLATAVPLVYRREESK
jgi:hypothetical protein